MANEFWFGNDKDREKAKKTLGEMRPKYERPKIGGGKSAPKVTRNEGIANPTYKPGGGSPVNSVSQSEMLRLKDSVQRKRESEARARKTDAAANNTAKIALNTDSSSAVPKFGGGPKARQGSSSPSDPRLGAVKASGGRGVTAYTTDRDPGYGGVLKKPAAKAAPKPKAKPTAAAPKAKPKSSSSSSSAFKGNWKGAAPTAMQARGGAKMKESSFSRTQRMQRERGVGGR